MTIKIAPSLLAADFLKLGDEIAAAQAGGADRLHLDVMDGVFVPNISFGMPVIAAARRATTLPLEAHLMIVQPERHIDAIAAAGADTLIVHQEACLHLDSVIEQIRAHGKKAGVALNPATPIATLTDVLPLLDLVLIMTVNPGFGGQKLIGYTLDKVQRMRALVDERHLHCEIEVDGGIDGHTAGDAARAGADVLVAGTMIFSHSDGAAAGIRELQTAVG